MLQVFVSDKGYLAVYPMEKKSEFVDALHQFCKEVGVPICLVVDPAREQTSKKVRRFCNQVGTTLRILQESTQWANRAELYIGFLKESVRKDMRRTNSPMKLWDHCAERRVAIHNLTPQTLFQTGSATPHEYQFGTPGDISNLCQFDWYDWCYYREEGTNLFPYGKEILGRVLGPFKNEGNEMAQAILNHKGAVVPRRSVRRLTETEMLKDSEKRKREEFDRRIKKKLGDSMFLPDPSEEKAELEDSDDFAYDERDDDNEEPRGWIDGDPVTRDGVTVYKNSLSDTLVNDDVLLPHEG